MDQLSLGQLLMKIGELPSLPHITGQVIELTDNPTATHSEISEVICQDHVLATKVLKLVNSAYFGLPRKIATISEAITILGLQTLRTFVIGTSIYKSLNDIKGKHATSPAPIWRHALACAVSSKILAVELGVGQKEQAFMAGLLHDIGKIVFNSCLPAEYLRILEVAETRGCSMADAEQDVLNTTHAEVGMVLARKWNLPPVLVDPIGGHHDSVFRGVNADMVLVVHLADIMAMLAGYTSWGKKEFTVDFEVFNRCNISYQQLSQMAAGIKGKINLDFI